MTMTVNNDAVKGIRAVLPKGLAGSWVRTLAWNAHAVRWFSEWLPV